MPSRERLRVENTLTGFRIGPDDPRSADVRALLATHLAFAHGAGPREYSFALDVDQLAGPGVVFFSAREEHRLLGIAALKRLDSAHAELKSMHTAEPHRGRGVGRALVAYILSYARDQGYERVSLETGTTDEFVPARALYANLGFRPCPAFGTYVPSPYNTFMTLLLQPKMVRP